MNDHPDLLGLLRAELTNQDVAHAGEHLDSCPDCRGDLAELATGHAMLTRSARTLEEPSSEAVPLPPLRRPSRSTGWRPRLLVAAAAVVAVIGAGLTAILLDRGDGAPAPVREQLSATLDPVEGSARGQLLMSVGPDSARMSITTRDLPRARSGQFYEAWLLDPATQKMLPLGQLGPTGQASFEIDDRLLGRYTAVDVSLEDDDGNPQHSVTSVLRASYDAPPPAAS
ncbi:anti-sigma factor [Nocardioides sp. MAHUQ-72]|uniref:anti-sigma factor n=1 Tax=unclassified Nocardioides TaxID=2615069 RepID=UPI003623E031